MLEEPAVQAVQSIRKGHAAVCPARSSRAPRIWQKAASMLGSGQAPGAHCACVMPVSSVQKAVSTGCSVGRTYA